jgi:hypothetical protein
MMPVVELPIKDLHPDDTLEDQAPEGATNSIPGE